jgi:hypothetical protein
MMIAQRYDEIVKNLTHSPSKNSLLHYKVQEDNRRFINSSQD